MNRSRIVALVLALGVIACSSGGSSGSNPAAPSTSVPPAASVTTVIAQTAGPLAFDEAAFIDFTIPASGTVSATVDWTLSSNHVIVALTSAACDDVEGAFLGGCVQIGSPRLGMDKPKTISAAAQPGPARLWIGNVGPGDESVAAQVTLTRPAGAASAQGSTSRVAGEWQRRRLGGAK